MLKTLPEEVLLLALLRCMCMWPGMWCASHCRRFSWYAGLIPRLERRRPPQEPPRFSFAEVRMIRWS